MLNFAHSCIELDNLPFGIKYLQFAQIGRTGGEDTGDSAKSCLPRAAYLEVKDFRCYRIDESEAEEVLKYTNRRNNCREEKS